MGTVSSKTMKGLRGEKSGRTELSIAIRGEEKDEQIIVYRLTVAMLPSSWRPGITETYTSHPFQLGGFSPVTSETGGESYFSA